MSGASTALIAERTRRRRRQNQDLADMRFIKLDYIQMQLRAARGGGREDSLAPVAEAARGRKARTRMRRVAGGLREEAGTREEERGQTKGEGEGGSCRRNEILTDFIVG
jgi:hypothetical protein